MAVFNTIEELVEILDENPQWIEALRARLLTRELRELPEKFAEFAEKTDKRFDSLEQQLGQFIEETNKFTEKMNKFVEEMNRFAATTNRRFEELEQRMDRRFNKMDIDHGRFRAAHARTAAIRQAPGIAADMGFQWTRDLDVNDLIHIIANGDTSDISANDLRKFRNADLVIEAVDDQGKTCYIAVEISYTADARDTDRAIMFAGFLKKFTIHDAQAAIVAVDIDDRIQEVTASGEVFWYPLEDKYLDVD